MVGVGAAEAERELAVEAGEGSRSALAAAVPTVELELPPGPIIASRAAKKIGLALIFKYSVFTFTHR